MEERKEICSWCHGSGKEYHGDNKLCSKCNGHGYILIETIGSLSGGSSTGGSSPPKTVKLTANAGSDAIANGQYDKAVAECTKALEDEDPKPRQYTFYAIAYVNRAIAYLNKGNIDNAISDCSKALGIRIDNKNSNNTQLIADNLAIALKTRGDAYIRKGENNKAIADYKLSADCHPIYRETILKNLAEMGIHYTHDAKCYPPKKVADTVPYFDIKTREEIKRANIGVQSTNNNGSSSSSGADIMDVSSGDYFNYFKDKFKGLFGK